LRLITINPPMFPVMEADDIKRRTMAIDFSLAVQRVAEAVSRNCFGRDVRIFHHTGASNAAVAQAIERRLSKKHTSTTVWEKCFHTISEVQNALSDRVSDKETAIVIESELEGSELLPGEAIKLSDKGRKEKIVQVELE
jgi:hypothetical protein